MRIQEVPGKRTGIAPVGADYPAAETSARLNQPVGKFSLYGIAAGTHPGTGYHGAGLALAQTDRILLAEKEE